MANLAGTCGKCGAPYFYTEEAWGGTGPPPVSPTCNCWNTAKTVDSASSDYSNWTWETTTYGCQHCMCIRHYVETVHTRNECCKCGHTIYIEVRS